jgi:hypothetical protein
MVISYVLRMAENYPQHTSRPVSAGPGWEDRPSAKERTSDCHPGALLGTLRPFVDRVLETISRLDSVVWPPGLSDLGEWRGISLTRG